MHAETPTRPCPPATGTAAALPLAAPASLAGAAPPLGLSARVGGRRLQARLDRDGRLRLRATLARAPFTAENPAARRRMLALFAFLRRRTGWGGRLVLGADASLALAAEARLPVTPPGRAVLVELVRFALAVRLLARLIDEDRIEHGPGNARAALSQGREPPAPGRDRSGSGCGSGPGWPGRSR